MKLNDPNAQEELHHGYDLENGILARMREWADVFPWIRLGRTLRVVGSPPMVTLTAITVAIWWVGATAILGANATTLWHVDGADAWIAIPVNVAAVVGKHLQTVNLAMSGPFSGNESFLWRDFAAAIWTVLVWAPMAILLARQGALLTAGRTMVALKPGLTHAFRRSPPAWLAVAVPIACVLAIGLLILVVGWLAKLSAGFSPLEIVFAVLIALIAIPCGILVFGAYVAVPLGWAALANEGDPDALDALSRGYEYLFRRPLRLLGYLVVAVVILALVALLAWGISAAGAAVAAAILSLAGCPPSVIEITVSLLHAIPVVAVLASIWSLIGGVYLLLRYDAGGQEVEDLWEPRPPFTLPLPEIPSS